MTMQDTMTMREAIEALDRLLDDFSFRSGGGDWETIRDAIEALKFLKSKERWSQLRDFADEISQTGSVATLIRALRLFDFDFEQLILFLEEVEYFAPAVGVEVREVTRKLLAHLLEIRQLLDSYKEVQP